MIKKIVNFLKDAYPELKPVIVSKAVNGGEATGISVKFRENTSIVWYPDNQDNLETKVEESVNKILSLVEMARDNCPLDQISIPMRYEDVKDKLSIGVMNISNAKTLKAHDIVTHIVEDLVLYPVVVLNEEMSFKVFKKHNKDGGVSEAQIFDAALHSPELEKAELHRFSDICCGWFEKSPDLLDEKPGSLSQELFCPLLSTGNYSTAGAIFSPKIQGKLARLFPDGFMVLPSSIYETLIVPCGEEELAPEELKDIVMEVNETDVVPPYQFLSNSVYTITEGKFIKVI